jgi:UDP-N-acetylmuramate-alanine ligase
MLCYTWVALHNIENSVAAITVAKYLGIDDEKIKSAVASFKGVKRRLNMYLHRNSPLPGRRGGAVFD